MFSLIIPIYNAEKYLEECLDSVVSQDYENLEIILVNDGSKDNSLEICKRYAEKDDRIRIIDKPNSGVSHTRNVGIEIAKGKYILFADADDYLTPNAIQCVAEELHKKPDCDMLVWGFSLIGSKNFVNDTGLLKANQPSCSPESMLSYLITTNMKKKLFGVIWRCAFKREVLIQKNIRFERHLRMSEDFKFLEDVLLAVNKVDVLAEELYVHRKNDESVTAKYVPDAHNNQLWINQWTEENVLNKYPELRCNLDCCYTNTYIFTMRNMCSPGTPYSFGQRLREIWKIRKQYEITKKLIIACKEKNVHSNKRKLILYALIVFMEPIYMLLYSIKRKTVF